MRLVIDMQGLQASNAKRGIGRYTSALVKHLLSSSRNHEIVLLLNGMLTQNILSIYKDFSYYLPKKSIVVWSGYGPVSANDNSNSTRKKINEKIREAFITRLSPDILLVTSLFEGFVDNAVTSIGNISTTIPTAVILYDLIPLIYTDIYLKNTIFKQWYLEKIDHMRRASLLLSISNSSGHEGVQYLGFDEHDIINISTDCSEKFKKLELSKNKRLALYKKYNLNPSFLLYTAGIDYRKNIERLLKAFSLLPGSLRKKHQLVIVCSIQGTDRYQLYKLCKKYGLDIQEVIFTGYIPQCDLIGLYNICNFFIFPSWHEGFGLPVLEAMRCGKAVIGGNISSIPEVIGNQEALFNPYNCNHIADKIEKVLTDKDFKVSLIEKATLHAKVFSWMISANNTWEALEKLYNKNIVSKPSFVPLIYDRRQYLAFISPLPPAKSGIATYSAELISALSKHYIIDVIIEQDEKLTDPYIIANCNIRNVQFFKNNINHYERILYHLGNSAFHGYMFKLLYHYPGVVVLHDFFISGAIAYVDLVTTELSGIWSKELYKSDGWHAVFTRYTTKDLDDVICKYPCNISVLQNSIGIIVHSSFSQKLATFFYEKPCGLDWAVIPHLRRPVYNIPRKKARRILGIAEHAFVVCSFGLLGPTKLNHKLLSAWLHSSLLNNKECYLIFVGENSNGEYGKNLLKLINNYSIGNRIHITGWVEDEDYKRWLSAADVGVQLRTLARGETSGTVLDCMNYGLATVVNAHGSMAELDDTSVIKLDDEFIESTLIDTLVLLYNDVAYRKKFQTAGIAKIRTSHRPIDCAEKYKNAIELFYKKSHCNEKQLINNIIRDNDIISSEYLKLATTIAKNYAPEPRKKQILIDVSELIQHDAKSGIQRVVRGILNQLLHAPPKGWVIEPIYTTESSSEYYYARHFTCQLLDIPLNWIHDRPIETWLGDLFLGLDFQPNIILSKQAYLRKLYYRGIKIHFIVYDLLPILAQECFLPGARDIYTQWLNCITQFDGAICISQAVSHELIYWIKDNHPERSQLFNVEWFHLGSNLADSVPSKNTLIDSTNILNKISKRMTFLMVCTIEPRKQHMQVLEAFELLWKNNKDINLVLVGKEGWMVNHFIKKLSTHIELNHRLFWLSTVTDEYLKQIYSIVSCLIVASMGEGFGLPLVEAAQYNVPIIARDIPVFREVAGEHAFYFDGTLAHHLYNAIDEWLQLKYNNKIPDVTGLKWLTWEQSAKQLLRALFKKDYVFGDPNL